MCGRYVNATSTAELLAEFEADEIVGGDIPPSWNVAPTDPVPMVLERAGRDATNGSLIRQVRAARWGLVPNWATDRRGAARLINARVETVAQKPAFRAAFERRRCLLPALGYYEWERADGRKLPYFLHDPNGSVLAMAGVYELWRDPARATDDPDRWLWSAAVLTQQASDVLGKIHDRSPVIVPRELRAAWLDCSRPQDAEALLGQIPTPRLTPYRVGPAVGNVRNNGPELLEPSTA